MNRLGFRGLLLISVSLLVLWTLSGIAMLDKIKLSEPVDNEKEHIIRVLIRTGTESSALRKIAEPFTKSSGIKVEFVELGRDNFFTALGTQLFAGSEAFDVMFMPNTSIAQFASANAILPLDPFIENPELTDLKSFNLDDFLAIYRYQNAIYALPTDISTHFLYYRSDLIPRPPDTWDEFYAVAELFTRSITTGSPTKWGATMPAVVPEERSKIFASLLWSFGGDVMREDTGQVMLDLEPSIRAGEFLVKMIQNKVIPDDLLSWDFARTRDALLSGEVAMAAPYWNASYKDIMQSTSRYKDSIKIALIPGTKEADGTIRRATFEHSWTLAINANSANPVDAWKFLEFATGEVGGKIYVEAGGIPARRSILGDERYRESRPDFGLLLESLQTARNEPYVPYYNALIEIEERALAKIITLYSEPESAFRAAADELRHLYQSIQINIANQSKYNLRNKE
ncbi:sugar ABC transporter substrate-binding protein [Cohnella sp. REN36]|uniref:ABC transporter substrate-binding protein n=1 Tax=Cohnella sp. REN36 TaxID=2887347 RepID=UPI001D14E003|nr:sugar ABC transporter substrate-binding protein [Cohnella sp. REN36]MCC3372261.1 sugar ABC transporter substrate-binding protein [Cohnella sp. REN36]